MKNNQSENDNLKALEQEIQVQEKALTDMLGRVMQSPLAEVHNALDTLKEDLLQVEKAGVKNARAVEAVLIEELQNESRRITKSVKELKADLAGMAAGSNEQFGRVIGTLDEVRTMLASIDARAGAHQQLLSAAAGELGKLNGAVLAMREQGAKAAMQLNASLNGFGQQLQQGMAAGSAQLAGQISSVASDLGPRFDAVDSAIGHSLKVVAQSNAAMLEGQKSVVVTVIQQELAAQMLPMQKRAMLLTVACGLSLASTIAMLAYIISR